MFEYEKSRFGLNGSVVFTGVKSDPENYFQIFDLFALTSREDPFPLVCIEAAALGKPVVCFQQSGGTPDWISKGAGVAIPYGDVEAMAQTILGLRNQPASVRKFATEGPRLAQSFDVNQIAPPDSGCDAANDGKLMKANNIADSATASAAASPRVSVILTVYKRTEYLAGALQSALAQSYRDFEIIVADDSGTSAAKAIVEAHSSDTRVRYWPNCETLGIARSIEAAAKMARGEFISILNDDDLWETDLLEKLVPPLMADSGRVLACADHWIMNANGQIDKALSDDWTEAFGRRLPEGIVAAPAGFAIEGGPTINITAVFRKNAIDWSLVVPEVSGAYDYWIGCLLAATRRPIYYVPQRLGRWRVHPKSATAVTTYDRTVYMCSTMLERRWFPELTSVLKEKLAESLIAVARSRLDSDRTGEARALFWQSFKVRPRTLPLTRSMATFLPTGLRRKLKGSMTARRGAEPARNPLAKWLQTDTD